MAFYDSVGWSGVGYVIHDYDEGEIGAALDYMVSAVRVRAANGSDIAVEYPAIGAHVPDDVDKKCHETIDAIVRVAVACGYMVTLHDLATLLLALTGKLRKTGMVHTFLR